MQLEPKYSSVSEHMDIELRTPNIATFVATGVAYYLCSDSSASDTKIAMTSKD